jgi:hypothetical protein
LGGVVTEEQIQVLADRELLGPKSKVGSRLVAGEEFPMEGTGAGSASRWVTSYAGSREVGSEDEEEEEEKEKEKEKDEVVEELPVPEDQAARRPESPAAKRQRELV